MKHRFFSSVTLNCIAFFFSFHTCQARYLLNLLSPYTASGSLMETKGPVPLHSVDNLSAIEHILKVG